jgi:hypothetical protein
MVVPGQFGVWLSLGWWVLVWITVIEINSMFTYHWLL